VLSLLSCIRISQKSQAVNKKTENHKKRLTNDCNSHIIVTYSTKKGSEKMTDQGKEIFVNLNDILAMLPDSKKEFLIGYAEGVLAMVTNQNNIPQPNAPSSA